MKRDDKIEAAMERALSIRADVKRFGETEVKMPALVLLAYRNILLEERLANCRCKKTQGDRP